MLTWPWPDVGQMLFLPLGLTALAFTDNFPGRTRHGFLLGSDTVERFEVDTVVIKSQ
jgi:hypothetical protein